MTTTRVPWYDLIGKRLAYGYLQGCKVQDVMQADSVRMPTGVFVKIDMYWHEIEFDTIRGERYVEVQS